MNRTRLIIAAMLALVLAVSAFGSGYAQTGNPPKPRGGGMMGGSGHMDGNMMNGSQMTGGHMNGSPMNGSPMNGGMMGANGAMRTYMLQAFAEAIGITEADFQA